MVRDSQEQGALSLYSAIAWAMHLAESQGETVIVAVLRDALHIAEQKSL